MPDRAWEYKSEATKLAGDQANGGPSADSTGVRLSSTNPVWLRDFLPLDCPNVRIMTFNHNTAWQSFASRQGLIGHADRLLQMLDNARQKKEVRHNFKEKLHRL